MLSWLSKQAQKLATPRRCLGSLALLLSAMALVNLADLPFTGPRFAHLTGGQAFLDLRLFYTADEACTAVSAYGPAGRHACLGFYATWDLAIPFLAFSFSALTLTQLWGDGGRKRLWLLAPLAALSFDLLENIFVSILIATFPDMPRWVASNAGVFTLLKWLAYGVSSGSLLAGFGRMVSHRYRNPDRS